MDDQVTRGIQPVVRAELPYLRCRARTTRRVQNKVAPTGPVGDGAIKASWTSNRSFGPNSPTCAAAHEQHAAPKKQGSPDRPGRGWGDQATRGIQPVVRAELPYRAPSIDFTSFRLSALHSDSSTPQPLNPSLAICPTPPACHHRRCPRLLRLLPAARRGSVICCLVFCGSRVATGGAVSDWCC